MYQEPDNYISEVMQLIGFDIQDEHIPDVFNARAREMSGVNTDDTWNCTGDGDNS